MATFNYQLIGNTNKKSIYITLSLGRGETYKKNTGFSIDKKDWSKDKNRPKQTIAELKKLYDNLDNLEKVLKTNLNNSIGNKEIINSIWLQTQLNTYKGKQTKTEINNNIFLTYFQTYLQNLPFQVNNKGIKGVTPRTIQRFRSIEKLISEYEQKELKKTILIKDIDHNFQNAFVTYLSKEKNYSTNYIGSIIKNIKTVCNNAKKQGIATNPNLEQMKSFKESISICVLSIEELEQIKNTTFNREALDNAKDWLIIGCYIGQRVSDLLKLTKKNITFKNGLDFIELTQQKTTKRVIIPLHPEVKDILDKRNGEFPHKISDQKFNEHIKEFARISGIDTEIKGNVINPETKRKVKGTYKKWELVTSHICRRSFATNFYTDIPTALLISITGHSTEKQFLEYIGKSAIDNAIQLAEYWTKITPRENPIFKVHKHAN